MGAAIGGIVGTDGEGRVDHAEEGSDSGVWVVVEFLGLGVQNEAEGIDKIGGDPGQGKSRDVVQVLCRVPCAECLHSNVDVLDLETEGQAYGQVLEDLSLRLFVHPDEVVIEREEEADLYQVCILGAIHWSSRWVKNQRNASRQAGGTRI